VLFILIRNKEMNKLFEEILKLEKIDRVTTLTFVFNTLEDKMLEGDYNFCDEFMEKIEIEKFNDSTLTGIIIISNPFQDKLKNLKNFILKVKELIYKNHSKEEADTIFLGLEEN